MASTWFITGASRGFGRELTEQLLARGDHVAATLRKPEQLADLAAAHGDRLWVRALDVTDTAQLRVVVDAAFTDLGRVDVVVSNAGYGVVGAAEELSDTQIDALIATNLTASIQLARAAVPHLRAQGGGRILQMSSMGGHIGFPGLSLYHTTKWGIEGFFEAFAPEVEPFGIRTTLIEPGMIPTSFYSAVQRAPQLGAYANNPAIRRGDTPLAAMPGDQAKVVAAMIDLAEADDPPRRLLLGSDAYTLVHAALADRLAAFEAQQDVASSTDADNFPPAAT
jgi:NAD(P)-dependent dehydrogenase (short-subunit alcohol dehydrogenase family)